MSILSKLDQSVIFALFSIVFGVINILLWKLLWKKSSSDTGVGIPDSSLMFEVKERLDETMEKNMRLEDQIWGVMDRLKEQEQFYKDFKKNILILMKKNISVIKGSVKKEDIIALIKDLNDSIRQDPGPDEQQSDDADIALDENLGKDLKDVQKNFKQLPDPADIYEISEGNLENLADNIVEEDNIRNIDFNFEDKADNDEIEQQPDSDEKVQEDNAGEMPVIQANDDDSEIGVDLNSEDLSKDD
ncbi:hypothetical protein ACFLTD_02510 [Elusimicrobiota bacterium]